MANTAQSLMMKTLKARQKMEEAFDECFNVMRACRPDPEHHLEPDEISWREEFDETDPEDRGIPRDFETNEFCVNEEDALRCVEEKMNLFERVHWHLDHFGSLFEDNICHIATELRECRHMLICRRDSAINIQKIMRGFKPRREYLTHLKYKPDSVGYLEAKKRWEKNCL